MSGKRIWDTRNTLDDSRFAIITASTSTVRSPQHIEKGQMRQIVENEIQRENDFDCSGNIQNDIEKLDLARDLISSGEYISRVKGEGGTGIPKIYKILMVDLHLPAKLDFGFKESKNIFYMEITV